MVYRLKSIKRPDFECEIETNADIVPIIREYRTHYLEMSKGYHNKDGKKWDYNYKNRLFYYDIVYDKRSERDLRYGPDWFRAFDTLGEISPKKGLPASKAQFGLQGDIRRVLADIFYVFYILEEKSEKKIERLKWKEKEYTNIGNVSEHIDRDRNVRIIFEAVNNNGDKEVVLLPIPLNDKQSFLTKYQSDFYILEDNERRIEFAFGNKVPYEDYKEKTYVSYVYEVRQMTQDFFWGTTKDYKLGLFYMDGEELIPFYALTVGDELITRYFGQEENKVELTDEEKDYFLELEKSNNWEEATKMYQMIECMRRIPIKFTVDLDGITYSVKRYLDGLEIDLDEKTSLSFNKLVLQITIEKDRFPIEWKILKDNHIIPETLYKTITDKEVVDWYEEVVKVFRVYIKENKDLEKLSELSNSKAEIAEVEKILYPSPFVPDKSVAKIVYEEKQKYVKTRKMPNFAIMGGPGCGKSTLVDRIAAYMKDATFSNELVLKKSTSDLKGAYVGQTANRVYALLEKAYNNKKIVFIDEAYNLQGDQYGKEALEMLLPLISGDRTDIECVDTESQEKGTKSFRFEEGVPGIWLAGYEQEMREMLVENPGLYRRMVKITLTEPTVEGLYSNLLDKVANDSSLRKHFNECEKEIKNYFGWASAKENIAYFGNYAGVEEFYRTCEVRLGGSGLINAKRCIREIIDEKKREIKKQYKAILAKNERKQKGETAKFEIQRDVSVVLDDVKGNDVAVSGMRQIVKMLMGREVYENGGINVPKGALLVGPPGTGKTMIARALAGEIQRSYDDSEKKEKSVAFISVLSTELNIPQKVSALFEEASEYDSSIIFIDELDAIGMRRELSSNSSILIQLMKEMDGFEERKNIFVMAATNAPESLDPALKRPGRFDRNIEVSYPNEEGRKAILQSYLEKLSDIKLGIEKLGEDKTLGDLAQEVAEKTVGFVPAELKNLVNEAAILHKEIEEPGNETIKYKHREGVTSQSVYECFRADILEALERIRIGELIEGSKEDCFQDTENTGSSAVAIHEVGHALVSVLLGIEPFEKITVISRGDALGYVSPSHKNSLRTKADFLKKIKVCLGGRVAEEIFYGEDISTGAVQDIQQATTYAENMVMLFGMSEKIGPMALKTYQTNYLEKGQSYRCSSEFVCKAEEDINEILRTQLGETRGMLKNHKELISKLAKYVFDKETLTGSEFVKEYEKLKNEV